MGPLRHSVAALSALVAAPVALTALACRPSWRAGWRERLGGGLRPPPGSIWLHAASVGEVNAALCLAREFDETGSGVYLSATTIDGRELLRRQRSSGGCSLAPLDHPWCVEAALSRVRPRLLALVETELWPSWIAAAKRRGISVVVVSGRLSDRHFPRYRRLRFLFGPTFESIAAVGARSEVDAERFEALGVPHERIRVTGDLKLDPPTGTSALAPDLVRALGEVPIFVAGSTHPGEEEAARQALLACQRRGVAAALVVAPRQPRRASTVEAMLRFSGVPVSRRSRLRGEILSAGDALVLDSIGELPALYAHASIAFVGGTLAPVGGHNLLEPISAGCPVLFGPHLENVREAAELAQRCGAGELVQNDEQLAQAVVCRLEDPALVRRRAAEGRRVLMTHRGSAKRTAELIRWVQSVHPAVHAGAADPVANRR